MSRLTRINEQMLRVSAHVVVYVVLGVLVRLAWLSAPTVIIILAVAGVGIIDEWSKQYVSGRHCSFKEMGLNVVGAVLGVLIAMIFTVSTVEGKERTADINRTLIHRAVFVWGSEDGAAVDQKILISHKIDTVF